MIDSLFFRQTSIYRHLYGCEAASEKFFQVFYDKMCIAQKNLKSMPSTTPDMNQDNDDLDDMIFTPKSGAMSPIASPTLHDRASMSTNEAFHHSEHPTTTASTFFASEASVNDYSSSKEIRRIQKRSGIDRSRCALHGSNTRRSSAIDSNVHHLSRTGVVGTRERFNRWIYRPVRLPVRIDLERKDVFIVKPVTSTPVAYILLHLDHKAAVSSFPLRFGLCNRSCASSNSFAKITIRNFRFDSPPLSRYRHLWCEWSFRIICAYKTQTRPITISFVKRWNSSMPSAVLKLAYSVY